MLLAQSYLLFSLYSSAFLWEGNEHSYHTLWWWKLLYYRGGTFINCREDFGLQS